MAEQNNVCVWPDGAWSWAADLAEMSHKSDDYLTVNVPEWADEEDVENIAAIVNANPTTDPMPLIVQYFGL